MRVWGVRLGDFIFLIIGTLFLLQSKTAPLGAFILITTYMSAKEDEERMERERQRRAIQHVEIEVIDGEEYEEVDVKESEEEYDEVDTAYPDAEDEFNDEEFRKNRRRWR